MRGAGGTLIYVVGTSLNDVRKAESLRDDFPELTTITLAELIGPPLLTELGRSVTRQRVQQYQRYMNDADRVLILTHNDPDPDAMASGLALRTLLRRTRQTAVLGCLEPVTRPENLRMVEVARSTGVSAKFAGSGGAIVGLFRDGRQYQDLVDALYQIRCTVLRPLIYEA